MVHSIEIKFGMHIIGHRRTNTIDFGVRRINSFFLHEYKKEVLYITAYGVKLLKVF